MADELKRMFDDQRLFNQLIWNPKGKSMSDTITRLKDLMLGMVEEGTEFLRTYEYKPHRRYRGRLQNVAHSHEELIDMFKFWLSIADASDFPIERLEEMYFAKSAVVRQRYTEEWMQQFHGPYAVVDIDDVIADYRTGIGNWLIQYGPSLLGLSGDRVREWIDKINRMMKVGAWFSYATLDLTREQWRQLKHVFRTEGGKRHLPVFTDAQPFLHWCREHNLTIVLVTSRPIDRYPNIFTDTVNWLNDNKLPFDFLWWAADKGERLQEAHALFQAGIAFAVDDDKRFVDQLRSEGIRTYHLNRYASYNEIKLTDDLAVVTLSELMEMEEDIWQTTQTQNIDLTQYTPEKNRETK